MLGRTGQVWRVALGLAVVGPAWAQAPAIELTEVGAEACPQPLALATLVAEMDQAEALSARFTPALPPEEKRALAPELSGHIKSVQRMVKDDLGCLATPVDPRTAARIHWFVGLSNLVVENEQARREALLAARGLAATWTPPAEGAYGTRHAVWDEYQGQPVSAGTTRTLPPSRSGARLVFDGRPSQERPSDRATVAQLLDAEGRVQWTAYLFRDDVLPPYDAEVTELAGGGRPRRTLGVSWPLAGGAVALGVASGVLYGMARATEREFKDLDQDRTLDELDQLRTQTGRRGALGLGLAITAGAGLAGAVVVGTF